MDSLSTELHLDIASRLGPSDLASCRLVSKYWEDIANKHVFHTVTIRYYKENARLAGLSEKSGLIPHIQVLKFELRDEFTDDEGNTTTIGSADPGARYIAHSPSNLGPKQVLDVLLGFVGLGCPIRKLHVYMEGLSAGVFQVWNVPLEFQPLFSNITDLEMDIAYVDVEICIRKYMGTCTLSEEGMAGSFMNTFQNLSRLSLRTASNTSSITTPPLDLWQMIGLTRIWASLRELVLVHTRASEEGLVSLLQSHAPTLRHSRIRKVCLESGGSWLSLFRSASTFLNLTSASIDHLYWEDPRCTADGTFRQRCLTHPSYSTGGLFTETMENEFARFLVDGGICPVVPGWMQCNLVSTR
jgi:hypothetical protein